MSNSLFLIAFLFLLTRCSFKQQTFPFLHLICIKNNNSKLSEQVYYIVCRYLSTQRYFSIALCKTFTSIGFGKRPEGQFTVVEISLSKNYTRLNTQTTFYFYQDRQLYFLFPG